MGQISEGMTFLKGNKQSVPMNGLCVSRLCFEFQSRGERSKGHKSCAMQMAFRGKVQS